MKKTITHNGVKLEYEFTIKNVKNINLRLNSKGLFLSANRHATLEEIESLIIKNFNKIINYQKNIKEKISAADENSLQLLGERISLPCNDINIDDYYKMMCMEIFPEIIDNAYDLLAEYNLPKTTLVVKKMKTLWGSCNTVKNKITLNSKLILASERCILSVAVHELVHLLVPNHSKDFYDILYKIMPDYDECKKILNKQINNMEF